MRAEFTQYAVPGWGVGEMWTSGGLLLTHEFRFQPVSDTGGLAPPDKSRPASATDAAKRMVIGTTDSECGTNGTHSTRLALDGKQCLTPGSLVERFVDFFAGRDVTFDDVPLDLDWATPFQQAVATRLRAVPRGEVVSYGELAAIAGYPGAARAAGSFCAHNRFMLVVPCHRVVGAHGLGGYGSAGIDTKRRLLELEGVVL